MRFKILQLVFLCISIVAIGEVHSSNDTTYEKANDLLNNCGNFNTPQEMSMAQECYDKVLDCCKDICPDDNCPTKITNLAVKAQEGIDTINIIIGPPPGDDACSCELGDDYALIAAKYNNSVIKNSSDVVAWNDRGAFFAEKCCFDEALRSFEEAIRIDSHLATPLYNKGVLLYNEEPLEALECFNQSIGIDPEFAEAWFNRCSLLLSFNIDLESPSGREAQRSYDKALELEPELGNYNPPYLDFKRMA